MRGEVVVLQLYDVGGTLDLAALERGFAPRAPRGLPAVGKGTPAYVEFPRPLVMGVTDLEVETPNGRRSATAQVSYYAIGAISVRVRIPVDATTLGELTPWHANVSTAQGVVSLEEAVKRLVEQDRPAWEAAVRDRYTRKVLHESYTVFAFHDVGEDATSFLERRATQVAGLLKGEDATRLHEKEVREATKKWFSYYADDVAVVDWDAAIIVDPDADYEDLLFVLEIANLQLLEFRAYDDYLDDLIEKSYDRLQKLFRRPSLFRNVRATVHELSLIRMEVAELADEADNITKFLGDWFLARIYQATQEKFHIADWRASVDDKLATVNKLYQLANDEGDSLRLLTLEWMIVALFVLDLLLLWVVR